MQKRLRRVGGFNLVELVVVVAIIGILAAIVVPNYVEYVQRSNRAEARSVLVDAAAWMERRYGESSSFILSGTGADQVFNNRYSNVPASGDARYHISLSNVTASSYTLIARPTGTMASDACGAFTIDSYGVRGVTGASRTVADCWGK